MNKRNIQIGDVGSGLQIESALGPRESLRDSAALIDESLSQKLFAGRAVCRGQRKTRANLRSLVPKTMMTSACLVRSALHCSSWCAVNSRCCESAYCVRRTSAFHGANALHQRLQNLAFTIHPSVILHRLSRNCKPG